MQAVCPSNFLHDAISDFLAREMSSNDGSDVLVVSEWENVETRRVSDDDGVGAAERDSLDNFCTIPVKSESGTVVALAGPRLDTVINDG